MVEIDKTKVIVQIFKPIHSKGTVFLLHGYLSHVGHLKHIIQYLNDNEYTVISYDLQGHGLSEGRPASIKNFADYVVTMEKLLNIAQEKMTGTFYLIGHSTGAAIAIDYILRHRDHLFKKVILVAPLIRSNHWHLSKFGLGMVRTLPFLTDVKRHYRKNSSNISYLNFTSKDPLQTNAIPLDWIGALVRWNKQIQKYRPTNSTTYIIQGNKDKTVDWKYNLEFMKNKFSHSQIVLVDNGRHELFNEAQQIREIVLTKIKQYLEK
nr:alpha/beta hydrolase [Aquibacillus halophilus]